MSIRKAIEAVLKVRPLVDEKGLFAEVLKGGEKTWPCRHGPDHTLPGKRVEREEDGRLTILIPCKKCGEYY